MLMRVMIAAAFLASAGCNTVEGFGKDISAVGGTVSKSAKETRSGRTRAIAGDPAACLPDSHGKLPSGRCGAARTPARAKAPAKQTAKTAAANPSAAKPVQPQDGVKPMNADAEPIKASARAKLGWWQPACGKPGERSCSRTGQ